ncbi:MAG: PIN domain-containing protein [Longimicrobiales bacterium]
MNAAFLDTSCLVAIAFGEAGGQKMLQTLERFDRILASNLLEAELRAAFAREGVDFDPAFLQGVDWVLPDRTLTPEIERILAGSYLRGADLWHLACALFVTEEPESLTFLSLDALQRAAASRLGFPTE